MALEFLDKFKSRPGLGRITQLLAAWGNPQNKMKVILISGTNGKGSTTAFLSSILIKAGYKTGSFFSPHLLRFNERIQINGRVIADSELKKMEAKVEEYVDGGNEITYFEAVAAIAYEYFAENNVEYAVMEVGMGGRLDAVNVVDEKIAIVTSIGFEHTKWLGSQISEIAYEKMGIAKSGLVITGAGNGLETIKSEARARGLSLLSYGEDFEAYVEKETGAGTVFDYSNKLQIKGLELGLLGKFQVRNASLAICAAEELGCSEIAIRAGLRDAKIAGRMEILSENPFIVADVAHNPAGVKALVDSVGVFGKKPIVCVFSAMKDKNYAEMLKVLGEVVDVFIVCAPENKERAEVPEKLFLEAEKNGETYSSKSIADAVEFAKELVPQNGMILITGSIYMMKEAYRELGKK